MCSFQGCTNEAKYVETGYCFSHYGQLRRGQKLRPLATKRKRPAKEPYSETMTCVICDETKHWTKFVIGRDSSYDECRACYRNGLKLAVETKEPPDLLALIDAFIDTQLGTDTSGNTGTY